jgi:hypothetical protein
MGIFLDPQPSEFIVIMREMFLTLFVIKNVVVLHIPDVALLIIGVWT